MADRLTRTLLGVCLPPLAVYLEQGSKARTGANLLLTLLGWLPGVFHCFHLLGLRPLTNLLCLALPPLPVFLQFNCSAEFFVAALLTALGWLPGVLLAYYVLG